MTALCAAHSMPVCRICNRTTKPAFGTVRKPLAQKKREQTRMSAEAEIQEGFGEKCLLLGFTEGDCVGKVCRSHIVAQQTIRDTYPMGAWRYVGEEFWRPLTRDTIFDVSGDPWDQVQLQQILDDNRNIIGACSKHNVDGLAMVDALDLRKAAGLASYPAGFSAFTHEYRFNIEGSTYWYHVPIEGAGA